MTALRKDFIEWMERKNYSASTIKAYVSSVSLLCRFYNRSPSELTDEDIVGYMNHLVNKKDYSQSSVTGAYSGIKLFWEQILDRPWNGRRLPRPKRVKTLPEVLSVEEVKCLIERTRNLKHKAIFQLLYSAGLRIGEISEAGAWRY